MQFPYAETEDSDADPATFDNRIVFRSSLQGRIGKIVVGYKKGEVSMRQLSCKSSTLRHQSHGYPW